MDHSIAPVHVNPSPNMEV